MNRTIIQNNTLDKITNKLEFNEEGIAIIDLEGLVKIELKKIFAIQLRPKGKSETHFADYILRNIKGTTSGNFFSYAPAHDEIFAPEIPFEVMPGENTLELKVYPRTKPEDAKTFFYKFNIDGRIYKSGQAMFIMESYTKNYSDDFLDKMAKLALMFQSKVKKYEQILKFKFSITKDGITQNRYWDRWIEIAHKSEPINEHNTENSTSELSVLATISLFLIISLYVFLLLEIYVVGSIQIRFYFVRAGLCTSLGAVVLGILALLQRCFVKRPKWWLAIISIPLASVFFWIMCLINVIYF